MAFVRLITAFVILTLAAPALAAVVTPAQSVFRTGDMIELSVLNDGISTIHFASSVPFVLHNVDTGEVFTFFGLAIVIPLEPGNTYPFGVSSRELTPGTYEIILNHYNDAWDKFTATADFILEAGVDVLTDSMSRLKSQYQE